MNNLPDERAERDRNIAKLLREGLPIEKIKQRLNTSYRAVARVRDTQLIPVLPSRIHRSPAEISKAETQAVKMLWAGATQRQVYEATRVSSNAQTRLRKEHGIPRRPSAASPSPPTKPRRRKQRETTQRDDPPPSARMSAATLPNSSSRKLT